ncbi:MAG: hypothetical protein K8V75_04280 [Methanobrevibacter woesei]|nr:hypothetical protein [Methanobrevibacter woesei]
MPCKYMRTKENWTPNDFEINFDYNNIPPNIRMDNVVNLTRQLQSLTPLTKRLHLMMDVDNLNLYNDVKISTKLRINDVEVKFI